MNNIINYLSTFNIINYENINTCIISELDKPKNELYPIPRAA